MGKILGPDPKRQYLGLQVKNFLDSYDGYAPDTREITYSVGKSHQRWIEDEIKANTNIKGKYYLWVGFRCVWWSDNVKQQFRQVRKSRPKPMWSTMLYSYDNDTSTLHFEWALPDEATGKDRVNNTEGYPFENVKFISDFLKGELV